MRIIHNINYDVTAQLEFRKIIYQNIIRGMKVITMISRMVMIVMVTDFWDNHYFGVRDDHDGSDGFSGLPSGR